MKNQKTISVVTDEENTIDIEIVAEAIVSISEAMKKITNSRLTRRALLLLVQDNCITIKRGYTRAKISTKTIDEVLNSINTLSRAYVKEIKK